MTASTSRLLIDSVDETNVRDSGKNGPYSSSQRRKSAENQIQRATIRLQQPVAISQGIVKAGCSGPQPEKTGGFLISWAIHLESHCFREKKSPRLGRTRPEYTCITILLAQRRMRSSAGTCPPAVMQGPKAVPFFSFNFPHKLRSKLSPRCHRTETCSLDLH